MKKPEGEKLTWHFLAPNVHDFMWAADRDYTHTKYIAKDGTLLRFFYQENERTKAPWEALPAIMSEALEFLNTNYGKYPYKVYSFVQGGDGGMEYPMATLITGERGLASLVGVSVHEMVHSWYQMVLGSNESLYAWMDEGFTTYASAETMNHLRAKRLIPGSQSPIHKPAITMATSDLLPVATKSRSPLMQITSTPIVLMAWLLTRKVACCWGN
ncbi:MAG: M1 family metallopeptidase [Saprospiraceae bacterium]|nr:M1 family metallopeptidase [Saprospiraceae bacterium]